MSPPPDVARIRQPSVLFLLGITTRMKEPDDATSGIEVTEQTLNPHELGFLSGVFEAWANRTMTEAEFRDAMTLIAASGEEVPNPGQ